MRADEIICDSFAGGGGASMGIHLALGRGPDIAINHDAEAIALHRANHPESRHYTEDVWKVDPHEATQGRPVGLMWLSPDCKHFSKAKGGKPVNKKVRGLAWVAVRWAKAVKPRVIVLENVEEFQTWGPLGPDGRPCPARRGLTFRRFVGRLRNLGYQVEWRELRACDYGAPTIRKRLFLIARCDGNRIMWPKPTHGKWTGVPYRTAASCIDWTIPAESIFDRKRPLVANTCRRIAKGAWRYVLNTRDPYIVEGHAPYLTEHANGSGQRVFDIQEPLRTQVAQVKGGHFALVSAFFEQANGGFYDGDGRDVLEPLSTICTSGANQRLVTAYFVKYYGNEREGVSLRDPMHTVTTKDRMGLVQCVHMPASAMSPELRAKAKRCADFLHEYLPEEVPACDAVMIGDLVLVDFTMRMLVPRELFRAQGFPDSYKITTGVDEDGRKVKLTKTAQVRMVGNSVAPPVAAAIVSANLTTHNLERAA